MSNHRYMDFELHTYFSVFRFNIETKKKIKKLWKSNKNIKINLERKNRWANEEMNSIKPSGLLSRIIRLKSFHFFELRWMRLRIKLNITVIILSLASTKFNKFFSFIFAHTNDMCFISWTLHLCTFVDGRICAEFAYLQKRKK